MSGFADMVKSGMGSRDAIAQGDISSVGGNNRAFVENIQTKLGNCQSCEIASPSKGGQSR